MRKVRICRQKNNPCLEHYKEKGEVEIVHTIASISFPSGKLKKSRSYFKCYWSSFCLEAKRYLEVSNG